MAEGKAAESALAAATARSQELLRLYERVYEDNVNGKVTDDWFMRLSHKYEVEQDELKKQMFDLKNKLERIDTAQNSSGSFIRAIRKFMTMQTLTPIVLQELIDKIEVFPIEGRVRTERKCTVSLTVCVNNAAFYYFTLFNIINLKLFGMTEMLEDFTVFVSYSNSHNIFSFFNIVFLYLLPFGTISFIAKFRVSVAEIILATFYFKGASENQSVG